MKKDFQYYSFIQGGILGLILLVITTMFYICDSHSLLPAMNIYSICFFTSLFMYSCYALIKFSKQYCVIQYNFKIYFSISFLLLAIALLISRIYIVILYNIIDINLITEYFTYTHQQHNIDLIGYSDDDWLELVQKNFSFLGQLQSYVFSLIPCTLYSAIISLLMKINHK